MKHFVLFFFATGVLNTFAQDKPKETAPQWKGKFEQLDQILPTPNEYRTGSGAPGLKYWQQQADYDIVAELHDDTQSISGSETITYFNNSPDVLKYLWLQLDQNLFAKENNTFKTTTNTLKDSSTAKTMANQLNLWDFEGGHKIETVRDASGKDLPYTINKTMMRIDLPQPVKPGGKYSFKVAWSFNIVDLNKTSSRSGLEFFPEEGNYIYTVAQWFPRMCVYDDVVGWQNKQFLGGGEFTLPFGNYKVSLTVPADHIVAATGIILNTTQVLSGEQIARFEKAKISFDKPVMIVTQLEASEKEKNKSKEKKTWQFEAINVRDFAFASSRKFIWDAMAVRIGNTTPMAMSFYPKEANPLWEKESTLAVKNTLEVYSKYTIDYPYPQASSVSWVNQGAMEYPMLSFNRTRPKKGGTYDGVALHRTLNGIIHEVGHNFFPMIVNSDERQTTWMDEGINSFLEYLTETERYADRGLTWDRAMPSALVPYMKGNKTTMRPLMTNAEQVIQGGAEQYGKAATSLNILRETVMGHELFDKAFKEYSQRWAFKHPKPADFFRTMEDASAVDLDWFWRGWFNSTDNVDLSLDQVKWFKLRNTQTNLEGKEKSVVKGDLASPKDDKRPLENFDNGPHYISVIPTDSRFYGEFQNKIDDKAVIAKLENKNLYEITLSNKGGLVMPVIIEWTYRDGTKEIERIPAEIWRVNESKVTKVFAKEKEVTSVTIDPRKETSDINTDDNLFPRSEQPSKFDELKKKTN